MRSRPQIRLKESQVAQQIQDFLKYRQWRRLRNNVGMGMGAGGGMVTFGERGMPDLLFLRYLEEREGIPPGTCVHLWVETKAPGRLNEKCRCQPLEKKVCRQCAQKQWREKERVRGGLVVVTDSIAEFAEWYEGKFGWLHKGESAIGQMRLI